MQRFAEVERASAAARSAELKSAIKDGRPARAVAHLPERHAQERAESETKLKASETALAELASEEQAAERALEATKARVGESVKAVVASEADSIAA